MNQRQWIDDFCANYLAVANERDRLKEENEKLKAMVARYVDMYAVMDTGEDGKDRSFGDPKCNRL